MEQRWRASRKVKRCSWSIVTFKSELSKALEEELIAGYQCKRNTTCVAFAIIPPLHGIPNIPVPTVVIPCKRCTTAKSMASATYCSRNHSNALSVASHSIQYMPGLFGDRVRYTFPDMYISGWGIRVVTPTPAGM